MPIKVKTNKGLVAARIREASKLARIAVTEQVIQYGTGYVRVDQPRCLFDVGG